MLQVREVPPMLGRTPETELVRLLFAAAQEAAGFEPFLEALIEVTRARDAALIVEAAGLHRFGQAEAPPLDALRRLRRERVYAQDEVGGATPMRLLSARARAEAQVWLIVAHPFRDFRAVDGAQLDRLAPHLGPAVEGWLALGQERARARQVGAAAAALGVGSVWLDASGRLIEADATARALLSAVSPPGRLDFADPLVARDVRRALERALSGGPGAPVVTLRHRPLLQLTLHPGLAPPAPGLEPVLRGFLCQHPLAGSLDPAALAASLELSRSETRLAVLLCDGLTLAEAAEALGWTVETTRSASKRVFARTGTRGQSDLIRRLLTGADWLAQG